jgi:nucleotide-binding universal stress UspA family protein
MAYKVILVHVEPGAESRVRLSADLAHRHDALLIGLAAGMWQLPVAMAGAELGGLSADIIEAGRVQVEGSLLSSEKMFSDLTAQTGVPTEWRSRLDFPSNALATSANAADLIVVGPLDRYTVGSEYRSVNPGDVLLEAGRPLLIVPEATSELRARHIVVAWKNTREARRALADALPLMERAETVLLVQVRENGGETDTISDAETFLRRHRVKVTSELRDLSASTVEEELLQCALGRQADLVVAGAYGRSRLREWILGGVTRGLLTQRSIACQLSH